MQLKYGVDDRPESTELILYGLQWIALTIPALLIIGKVVAEIHYIDTLRQILYMQKLVLVTGVLFIAQVLWGHRLPLVIGPAAVLLVGIIASQSYGIDVIYTSIFLGGLLLAILSFTGLFSYMQVLFTPRVVSVILILIAFTLAPTIMNLVTAANSIPVIINLCFAILLTLGIFIANKYLTGLWKAGLIIWAMIIGSLAYIFLFPRAVVPLQLQQVSFFAPCFSDISWGFAFDAGVIISFLFAFLALSINDLGSIQSVGNMLKVGNMEERTKRGIGVTGLGNALAGLFGVIGSVNFSFSPGIIAATGCASRFPLILAGSGLILLSFFPAIIGFISSIPPVVIGSILIYLMSSQIAAGLLLANENQAVTEFNDGVIIGFPLLIATVIAFLPGDILAAFPQTLRPLLGNGFVMGVITVIILEHIVFRKIN